MCQVTPPPSSSWVMSIKPTGSGWGFPVEGGTGGAGKQGGSGPRAQKGRPDSRTNDTCPSHWTCFPVPCFTRLRPSADCGPFRGLPLFIHSIYSWIDTLSDRPGYQWVVWIYKNLIGSVHFFFILTLIVL